MWSINLQQLEAGDGDDVGCVGVVECLAQFGTDSAVDAGKELD